MKYKTGSLDETQSVALDFISKIKKTENDATVVGLYGDLGAGKTSFTQGLAKYLGIKENVVSPTFVIEKIYHLENNIFKHLIHIDAYRIEKSQELLSLGFKKIISDPENLIVIEWPERISDIMPEHIRIDLRHISENNREIEISK
ncbi:MAG: tRNA (adenosine(37)-N6)-threonylcarbamoyltransferase complex ATPase subunit type 1 TsaE [Candidatus Paceibacterota bacterium]